MPAFATQGIVKLVVDIVDQPGITTAADHSEVEKELLLLNVLQVKRPLDLTVYLALSNDEKSRLQLELIHTACLVLGSKREWPQAPFEEAYAHCLQASLTNTWVMKIGRKRFFRSPDGRFTACAVCQWTLNQFMVDIVLMSTKGNDYQCQRIVENEPFQEHGFSEAHWLDGQTFQVTAARPTRHWQAHLRGGTSTALH
ncbi:hypothetical protein [Hymenobacter norwichensis]|uniref:hypothetical protein n=1 Tax=Hymenobacter norwichensis TaxID=223903 RepID=UPI0012FC0F03|nr:hypothetical protein [Hymenobacter norwichensis]